MSDFVQYQPPSFSFERTTGVFEVGIESWVSVDVATFVHNGPNYNMDENGTLIYDSEVASCTKSYWGDGLVTEYPLRVGNRVRVTYELDGEDYEFLGTVEKVGIKMYAVPEARKHGHRFRVDFTASLLGTYAIALSQQVCWEALPAELAIERIRRFVTVNGWPD